MANFETVVNTENIVSTGLGYGFAEEQGLRGDVKITVFDENGNIIETREGRNLIVNNGKQLLAKRIGGAADAAVTHMAIGTGGAASETPFTPYTPAATNTALGTEVAGQRQAVTVTYPATNQVKFTATFTSTNVNNNVNEVGLFNASTAGTMFARYCFATIYLKNDITASLQVDWTITFS